MNRPVRDIVLDILAIVQYPNDKDKFLDDFLSENYVKALISVTERLPEELRKKSDLRSEDFTEFTPEDIAKVKEYVSDEDFIKELDRISKEEIKKMVDSIKNEVKDEEKQKLEAIVNSLDEAPASDSNPSMDAGQGAVDSQTTPVDPSQVVAPPYVPPTTEETSAPQETPAPVTPSEETPKE